MPRKQRTREAGEKIKNNQAKKENIQQITYQINFTFKKTMTVIGISSLV